MHSITFRISDQDKRDLDYIVAEMQASTSVDLRQSDILRMLIRESAQRRRAYGAHSLQDVVCKRTEDGQAVVTGVRHDLVILSPTGFEWGYFGAGPSDLAFNILLTATGDRSFASRHNTRFLDEVVARIPLSGGVIPASKVLECIARFHDDDRAREAVSRREDANTE